jgi:hypothetical protein
MEIEVQKHDGSREKLDESALADRVRAGGLVFEIMGRSGDVKKIWDPTKSVEVEDARASFDNLTGKGYRAFRTDAAGKEGDLMKSFDPEAGRVVFVPQMQGG